MPATLALPMPLRPYKEDEFWIGLSSTFALFFVLMVIYPVSQLIQHVVLEKETRQLELQLMMSQTPVAYYAALYVMYDTMALLLAGVLTLLSSINLFEYSDLSVVFVYYLLYLLSLVSFCMFVASLFRKPRRLLPTRVLSI